MKRISVFALLLALLIVPQYLASQSMQLKKDNQGRLSPASLDIDACGCPTVFGPPVCEERTSWSLQKAANNGNLTDPDNTPYSFTISVIEGPTTKELRGTGELNIINSGEVTTYLSSVALLLEDKKDTPGPGDAPGPSGKNWTVLSVATDLKEQNDCNGVAQTCYGPITPTPGSNLLVSDPYDAMARLADIPIPPTIDNDGDGLRDEDPALPEDPALRTGACAVIDNDGDGLYDEDPIDFEWVDTDGDGVPDTEVGIDNDGDGLVNEDDPDDDGDGLVDEDGTCEDAVRLTFEYSLNIAGLDLQPGDGQVPSPDDLRLDMVVTFIAGGKRGGTCKVDADCDGSISREEEYVRSVQQRHQFDMPACSQVCNCVDLTDGGATVDDPACVSLTSNSLSEHICANGEGTTSDFTISGEVSCLGGQCQTTVRNTATLSCDDPTLIAGSPASAAFGVGCSEVTPPPPGDYCTQTQGGWGAPPAGNNAAQCMYDWWWSVFGYNPAGQCFIPIGVFLGDPCCGNFAWFIDPTMVTNFLPQGGPAGTLDGTYFFPQSTSAGVFGGQLLAATISLAFSDYNAANGGQLICPTRDFPAGLGELVYYSCVDDYFIGRTVRSVIEESHKVIGNCQAPAVPLSAYVEALDKLNNSYVDCNDQMLHCFTDPNALMVAAPAEPGDGPRMTPETPAETQLLQNTPNPFNPTTTIHFALAERGHVEVTVYDVRGRVVQRLLNEEMPAGVHSVGWNGKTISGADAASGVYFYRMRAGSYVETRRMVLLK